MKKPPIARLASCICNQHELYNHMFLNVCSVFKKLRKDRTLFFLIGRELFFILKKHQNFSPRGNICVSLNVRLIKPPDLDNSTRYTGHLKQNKKRLQL